MSSNNNNKKSDSDKGNNQKACTSHVSHSVRLGRCHRLPLPPSPFLSLSARDSLRQHGVLWGRTHGARATSGVILGCACSGAISGRLLAVSRPSVFYFFFLIKCVFDSSLRCKKRISYLPCTKPMPIHIHSQLSQLTLIQSKHSD